MTRKNRTIRKRSTAVWLAVLLSYWTWAYTYRDDAWKFWLGFALCITGLFMLLIPNLIVWIWSIVDVCKKDDAWYEEY